MAAEEVEEDSVQIIDNKKSEETSWSVTNTRLVIDLCRDNPVLYDKKSKDYGNQVTTKKVQWNPDFSSPRFPEPLDISNQMLFPLDLLHSSSTISPPISRTLDFSKLPITRTNFGSRGAN